MKLSKALEDSYFFSGKVSANSRQLAFAGIAIIWLFKKTTINSPEIYLPLICFISALAIDLLQYVVATVTWTLFHRHHEKKTKSPEDDPDIPAPSYLNWITWFLFSFKVIVILFACVVLIRSI